MNIKQLKSELEDSLYMKTISQTIGEVATMRVKATRRQIEHAGSYFQEVSQVFQALKILAGKETPFKTNGKTLSILLTSNLKFNGEIDDKVTDYYIEKTAKWTTDRLVIGSTGQALLTAQHYPYPTAFYQFSQDFPQLTEIQKLVSVIKSYSQILVFYTRFVSLLNQSPAVADLSPTAQVDLPTTAKIGYILEPEIDTMLAFFEDQIIILLLQSIFLQQQLARLAARMMAMNQAEQNADKVIAHQQTSLIRSKKLLIDSQILEAYSARKGLNEHI